MKTTVSCVSAAVATLLTVTALASSHREAPFVSKYPQSDGTDFYLFKSYEPGREDYVTLIANYIPVQAAYGGPNYFPLDSQALYEIHVDNDGDSVEDLTFQFRFEDSFPAGGPIRLNVAGEEISSVLRNIGVLSAEDQTGLNHLESYKVSVVSGDRRRGNREPATNIETGGDVSSQNPSTMRAPRPSAVPETTQPTPTTSSTTSTSPVAALLAACLSGSVTKRSS